MSQKIPGHRCAVRRQCRQICQQQLLAEQFCPNMARGLQQLSARRPVCPIQHRKGKCPCLLFSNTHDVMSRRPRVTASSLLQGEEITYDYNFSNSPDLYACQCGSSQCRGTLART
eukprot:scaffold181615_cov24-Prasinocladus_malaysianus.AAC.1